MAMLQQEADREMLAQVAGGEQNAFTRLYDRLSGPLYSLAVRMLGDTSEAQDVLQDVFVQIWRRAASYDASQSSVFSWAMLITRSRVIDRLRARDRRLRVVVPAADDDETVRSADASSVESAADTADRNEEAERVRFLLGKLPSEQREVIELAFFNGLTHHEIADHLSQPLGTIKARIRRGLLRMRERISA